MAVQSDWDRIEIACERLGRSHQQLAAAMGVSTTALAAWSDEIPSARRAKLAEVLGVSVEWISTGRNPPAWYVTMVMTSGRGCVDWSTLPVTEVLSVWWETVEGALFDRLQKPQCRLAIPDHVRVARWRFTLIRHGSNPDPRPDDVSLFAQLDPRQMEMLACDLGVWPRDADLVAIIRTSLPKEPCCFTGASSDDIGLWHEVVRRLADGARRYRKARSDRLRQIEWQSSIWKLLTERQGAEPLLAGRAIVPVLGACIRAARTTEILSAMRSELEVAVQTALVTEFSGRDFTIKDMCGFLERHRGLRVMSSGRGRRGVVSSDTISDDTVLRSLKKIAAAGNQPLTLIHSPRTRSAAGRTWRMGIPKQSTDAHPV